MVFDKSVVNVVRTLVTSDLSMRVNAAVEGESLVHGIAHARSDVRYKPFHGHGFCSAVEGAYAVLFYGDSHGLREVCRNPYVTRPPGRSLVKDQNALGSGDVDRAEYSLGKGSIETFGAVVGVLSSRRQRRTNLSGYACAIRVRQAPGRSLVEQTGGADANLGDQLVRGLRPIARQQIRRGGHVAHEIYAVLRHSVAQLVEFLERQIESVADNHVDIGDSRFERRRKTPGVYRSRNIGPEHRWMSATLLHGGMNPCDCRFIDQVDSADESVVCGNDQHSLAGFDLRAVVDEVVDGDSDCFRHGLREVGVHR